MSENIIKKGLEYCHNNFYKPIFVHFKGERFVRQGVVCYVVVNAQVDVVRHVEMAVV